MISEPYGYGLGHPLVEDEEFSRSEPMTSVNPDLLNHIM